MINKIRSSLFAKVFIITSMMLLCIALLVFGLLALLMPRTYANKLNAFLDEQTRAFVSELEKVDFSESGGLFEQFLQNMEVDSVELYNGNGELIALPAEPFDNELIYAAQAQTEMSGEDSPVLSGSYYFSFSDSSERYMMIVYGTAEQIAEIQQSFLQIFPFLLFVIFAAAFAISWAFSRMITRPVLELSRVSEKMSDLQLEWTVSEQRTDELGTLGKSLNLLCKNLSAALAELQSANKKLEDDIAREKELEQIRTDFFSAVSHELKTPITIIKGQIEGMLLQIGVYKDRETYLSKALETAGTLETMVQEILTISRLETMGTDFKEDILDCVQMIRCYLDETEDIIAKKDLQLYLDMPETACICGNRLLMEKVFSNLIGNAVKYSPQGAAVWISVSAECSRLVFSVENAGTQIPKDSIPKLFDAFYRVEQSRNRKTGGSGLGLYIVQKILRLHGSACTVCNTRSGVKFSFVIEPRCSLTTHKSQKDSKYVTKINAILLM